MFLVCLHCLIIHVIITKVGMIFVESEILRNGNDQLLNALEEGVVIQRKYSKEIVFLNTASKNLQRPVDLDGKNGSFTDNLNMQLDLDL